MCVKRKRPFPRSLRVGGIFGRDQTFEGGSIPRIRSWGASFANFVGMMWISPAWDYIGKRDFLITASFLHPSPIIYYINPRQRPFKMGPDVMPQAPRCLRILGRRRFRQRGKGGGGALFLWSLREEEGAWWSCRRTDRVALSLSNLPGDLLRRLKH